MAGFIASLGASKETRKMLFYGICIWVRLFMAAMALYHGHKAVFLIGTVAFVAFLNNLYLSQVEQVWWCRSCHAILALAIVILSYIFPENYNGILASLLLLDVSFGFLYSLYIRAFE